MTAEEDSPRNGNERTARKGEMKIDIVQCRLEAITGEMVARAEQAEDLEELSDRLRSVAVEIEAVAELCDGDTSE